MTATLRHLLSCHMLCDVGSTCATCVCYVSDAACPQATHVHALSTRWGLDVLRLVCVQRWREATLRSRKCSPCTKHSWQTAFQMPSRPSVRPHEISHIPSMSPSNFITHVRRTNTLLMQTPIKYCVTLAVFSSHPLRIALVTMVHTSEHGSRNRYRFAVPLAGEGRRIFAHSPIH